MKLFLTSTLALSLIGGSAALAQPRPNARPDQSNRSQVEDSHQWSPGEHVPANYRTSDRYVGSHANHLRRPVRDHRWVRTDNGNFAEIALATGLIYLIANAR